MPSINIAGIRRYESFAIKMHRIEAAAMDERMNRILNDLTIS